MSDNTDARPRGETLHCLDLFSGLGGFSQTFRESDRWEVTTVEIEERFEPDIQADVMDLRPGDLPDADLVLASPPCTQFSMAASRYERFVDGEPNTPEASEAVALVYHTIGLIKALSPRYWFLENPQGYLRQVLGEPTGRVTYCQYGRPYMKPTDLWGDHPAGFSYRSCSYGSACHEYNTDQENGGTGNFRDFQDVIRDPAERAKVPEELSEAIREAVEEAIDTPQPEQSELPLVADGGPNALPTDEI